MNAREELEHYLTFSGHGPQKRKALIDAFAHELAEQQRSLADANDELDHDHHVYGFSGAVRKAADLIDPSAGPARPDEEPTP